MAALPEPESSVALQRVDLRLRDRVLRLAPAPAQAPFSGVAVDTLPAAERHPTREPVAVLRAGRPVGFLALDPADDICRYTAPHASVALRAFFVDLRWQGQGIATAALALLPGYALQHYPDAEWLVLTVNVSNPNATRVYLRTGWEDTGQLHHAGGLGPQRVLLQPLR